MTVVIMNLALVILYFVHLSTFSTALIDRLYCGSSNCYELLETSRDASQAEIRKAYRKQAIRYHPDKNKEKGSRAKFEAISTAYEVLKDEEERENYNYMLDHPEEVYGHYYRYYRRRTPQIDVRLVLVSSVLVISIIQYLGWWHSYRTAVSAALRMPKYRTRAKEIAVSRGLIGEGRRKKRGREGKEEEETILGMIVEENLDVIGGYRRPRFLDVLLFRVLLLPYTLVMYIWWYGRWVWLFNVNKQEYGPNEMNYLTRKVLKLSSTHWDVLEVDQKEELLSRELWVKGNLSQWRKEQVEEQRVKLAENNKHKMYRRYMKSHHKSMPTLED